jgi:hypothetical protein
MLHAGCTHAHSYRKISLVPSMASHYEPNVVEGTFIGETEMDSYTLRGNILLRHLFVSVYVNYLRKNFVYSNVETGVAE